MTKVEEIMLLKTNIENMYSNYAFRINIHAHYELIYHCAQVCRMRNRLCSAYHIERSIANRLQLHEYPCACNRCRGAVVRRVSTIAKHHVRNGRDPYLIYPVLVSSTCRVMFMRTSPIDTANQIIFQIT